MKQNRITIKDKKLKEILKKGRKNLKKNFFELLKRAAKTNN
jgi:hypothetical protein